MPKFSTLDYLSQICYIAFKCGVFGAIVEPVLKAEVFSSSSVGRPVSRPLIYRWAALLLQMFTK